MRIGLFGGSFDPVHLGHVYLVQVLKELHHLDKVVIIPAKVSPFKIDHPPKASGKERMEMLRLAFSSEEGIELSSCEIDRDPPSYTIDTIVEMEKKYPKDELYLLLTEDAKERFSEWKAKGDIEKKCTILFGPKMGKISSTFVRDALKTGGEYKQFLSPKVLDYIKKKGLYS